jgi:hypothetical protein
MKPLKLFCLSFLLLAFLTHNKAYAQEEAEADVFKVEYKHHLGAAAGFTTGYGLSYRYNFSRYALQLTFSPYITEDHKVISSGIGFLYYLSKDKRVNFYLYQANHFHYRYEKYGYYNYDAYYSHGHDEWEKYEESNIHNGIGFGVELISHNRISTNAMVGYAAYNNFSNFSLTGELAIYYRF